MACEGQITAASDVVVLEAHPIKCGPMPSLYENCEPAVHTYRAATVSVCIICYRRCNCSCRL
eukprot:scaffold541079_cov17-Prasinocladus_malaysianus.AAC.1